MLEQLKAWFKRRGHKWSYRNPYDRTCKVCKRHEVEYSLGFGSAWFRSWWETYSNGEETHPCSEKD